MRTFKLNACLTALSLAALCPSVQSAEPLISFDFNEQSISNINDPSATYLTGDPNHGDISFSTEAKSGYGLEVDSLRYLRIPLDQISNNAVTVKFDYYHIDSTPEGNTAWHSHSFALRDTSNGYMWSHGFRNLGNDFWSDAMAGITKDGAQIKGNADDIPNFAKNTWHEYVLVFHDSQVDWYVDGVFAYTQKFNTSFSQWDWSNTDITIGARFKGGSTTEIDGLDAYLNQTGNNNHLGSVHAIFDNVRIWDSALTESEITAGVENLVPEEAYLSINKEYIKSSSANQQVSLYVSSNQAWQIDDLPSWVHADISSGDGDAEVILTLEENALFNPREATININGQAITILQSAAYALDHSDAVIFPDSENQEIEYMFYDLKSSWGATMGDDFADKLYLIDGFNGVRTSIYGTRDRPDQANGKPAHPEAGVVDASYYAPEVQKIKAAMARNENLIVFASKKLNGPYSFPEWVLQSDGVDPEKYAILLADYIEYMASEGIPTHILGIDNEYIFNEGKIWPDRFQKIVGFLKTLSAERGFPMPQIIGYEDYEPGLRDWMGNLNRNGWLDTMDIYGTHYYPEDRREREINLLRQDISNSGFKDRWHSELHWNTKSDIPDIEEIEDGLGSLFDMTDHGFNGLMWWSYGRSGLRGNIMRELMGNLLNYSPVMSDDHDGSDILTDGKLHTRVLRKGNQIRVWVMNFSTENSYQDYQFSLNNRKLSDPVWYRQYSETIPAGETGYAEQINDKSFTLDFPPMTVTTFSFNLDTANDQVLLNESWDNLPMGEVNANQILAADHNWQQQSDTVSGMSIIDADGPLSSNALALKSLADNSRLTVDLNSPIRAENYDALTLSLNVMFDSTSDTLGARRTVEILNQAGDAAYQLILNSSNSATSIAELAVDGLQGKQTIDLGIPEEFEANVPYQIHLTITPNSDSQTQIAWVIYRNKINWAHGNSFVTTATDPSYDLNQLSIKNSNSSRMLIDDIQLIAEGYQAPPVDGDLDGDAAITPADLTLFRAQLGKRVSDSDFNEAADLDNDGIVSRRDYSLFYSLYRQNN
ncbi:LamG-like jellyroll fold domain-containing protein [Gayadomonas joobiniege]|uniref:LamG-like jellyroll fold domain-containing protein n=1 Tax=Gayadomonas joobiniege TaxID=1234606 RepID=UPI00036D6F13|nr:dockerin type I domain-containing protein [Gayadomonas joobiniege]